MMKGIHCIFTITLLVLTFAVYSDAVCCGRGSKGFCKDCTRVTVFGSGAKCCGAGSGGGSGCNIFCCNCGGGKCKSGNPKITYKHGWWLGARYSCTPQEGDAEASDVRNDISETRNFFDSLDLDKDNSLSYDEFTEALRQHMNLDFESSYSLAADLLKDDDYNQEDVISLIDVAQNNKDLDGDTRIEDVMDLVQKEFLKMDTNQDGAIQAKEFDRDL